MTSKGSIANVYFAKLGKQAERYDEMAQHMRNVGNAGSPLSVKNNCGERKLGRSSRVSGLQHGTW